MLWCLARIHWAVLCHCNKFMVLAAEWLHYACRGIHTMLIMVCLWLLRLHTVILTFFSFESRKKTTSISRACWIGGGSRLGEQLGILRIFWNEQFLLFLFSPVTELLVWSQWEWLFSISLFFSLFIYLTVWSSSGTVPFYHCSFYLC